MQQALVAAGAAKKRTEPVSPWSPSRSATARVKNPLPAPTECPYCASSVKLVNNSEIYGRSYGEWPWAYCCTECDASVGLHPFTSIPLGTLADAELRNARKEAKAAFNPVWQRGKMSRTAAYAWLAGAVNIADVETCHIGWFGIDQCARVVEVCACGQ